ncbi:Thioredoxin-like 3-3 [Nymphaea thermarum]|nr:Thioredoxin-like 3-3 [Nymphaea thermarum]
MYRAGTGTSTRTQVSLVRLVHRQRRRKWKMLVEQRDQTTSQCSLPIVGSKSLPVTLRWRRLCKASNRLKLLCRICSQILPTFCQLSNEFPNISFVYADIDECPETTQNIRYTPTFRFFRDGERVDEMYGAGEERLRDRLWLHS